MRSISCALHCEHQKEGFCTHESYVDTYKACAHYNPTEVITTRQPYLPDFEWDQRYA